MKFIRLEIKNLASLDRPEGEVIEFEKGPLAGSTIFSIVGPTETSQSRYMEPKTRTKTHDSHRPTAATYSPEANAKATAGLHFWLTTAHSGGPNGL